MPFANGVVISPLDPSQTLTGTSHRGPSPVTCPRRSGGRLVSVAPPAYPTGSIPAASPPRAHGAGGGWEPPRVPARPVPRSPAFLPEEAVNEVKRQAMSELQKAVSDAERKAHELITTERAKMERALAEAKRQASEDALTVINQQEDSSEVGLEGTRLGGGEGTGWVLGTCSAAPGWLRHRWWGGNSCSEWGWDGEGGLGRGVRGLG